MKVAALLALLLAADGCSFSEDLRGPRGNPPSPEKRDAYVACRSFAPARHLPDGHPATLGDLLRLVEEGSVPVQEARARVRAAEASVDRARADLLPNLVIGAQGLGYSKQPGSSGFTTDRHVADAMVDLSVPLDLSGRLAASVRAAQARYRSAGWALAAAAREQRLVATQAYFNLLEAQDLAVVNELAVAVQERALKEGRARQEVGTIRKNDVLVIEVALSNSRQRGVALAAAIKDARRALNAVVGLPIDHPTAVAPFDHLIPPVPDVVPLLDHARTGNPEVDVLIETRTALLQELVANARSEYPDVSIGPRLTATTDGAIEPGANFVGFLAVSWNPDLNGRIQADRRGLHAQMLEVAWTITGLLRGLEERILRAHEATIERTSALDAARTSVSQADENLRINLELFRTGINTGRETLEAQALLSQQEGTIKTARHQANAAHFELRYLAGYDPLETFETVAAAAAESRPESR